MLVIAPTQIKKDIATKLDSRKYINLIIATTPAIIIVLACNNDDTGVGPSIAYNNQDQEILVQIFQPMQQKNKFQ